MAKLNTKIVMLDYPHLYKLTQLKPIVKDVSVVKTEKIDIFERR